MNMKETDKKMISAILLVFGWVIVAMTVIIVWVQWEFTWIAGRVLILGTAMLLVRMKYFPETFGNEES